MSQQPTLHPLADHYLGELGRLLQGIEPADRAEVLEGVREHIHASLEGTAGADADVQAALDELGPPQVVAEEAYAGRPQVVGPRPVPVTSRVWLPLVVTAVAALTQMVMLAVISMAAVVTTSSSSTGSSVEGATTTVTDSAFLGTLGAGLISFVVSLPFWLVLLVLVAVTALWTAREKAALLALTPVSALLFAVLPEIGYAVFGINGAYAGSWIGLAIAVLGGAALVWVLARRATRRAAALSRS